VAYFRFIGIGASAGGLETFRHLLPLLPAKNDYIYIIAQHMDPRNKSSLVEILSAYTDMPVQEIGTEHEFAPNTLNIIPPGYNLVYEKSKLLLEKIPDAPHIPSPSIDELFKSLSNYKKENCIGIVLTGSGHDGVDGVKIIKQNGGITIAQSPEQAKYKSMPQSAIDSGYIDYVLTLEDISNSLEDITHIMPKPLTTIARLLKEKEHLDIQKYKDETIMRRLLKRMFLTKCKNLQEYISYLNIHQEEIHLLYQNILIGVTEFFRNKESFKVLEEEILVYLKDKPENYELRVWSIACSTGEEAYSLAILIDKVSKKLKKKLDVSIFATDIDNKALEVAKKGIYPKKSFEEIDKDTLQNYFIEIDDSYKVIESIRSQIVFTNHNILNDPPFINQDLISCRNFLIYILPEIQGELFSLFHYALKEDGLLFLGSSESTLMSVQYFKPLNSEHKIYIKEKLKNPPKISSHYFSKHLQEKTNKSLTHTGRIQNLNIKEKITNAIFELFSPECIVVDGNFSIVYKKGSNSFLTLPDGFVTLNIIENLQKDLRYSVKKLLDKVFKTSAPDSTKFIQISLDKDKQTFVRVIAYPFEDKDQTTLIMLYFQELNSNDLEFNINEIVLPNESYVIQNLTNQVKELQEDNHSLLDELTISKENMQLLNEELQSSNEELQSSNEELETSNEELQSSNEELHASIANEQRLQRQLSLILNSTHDGIIGFDLEGRHTFVNNAALKMLGYKRDELIGKNAHKIWHHTKADGKHYPFEECLLHNHLLQGKSVHQEDLFFKQDGTPFEVEVLQNPIIEDNKVLGAVLSFHDITEKNRLKKEAEYEHKLADLYVNTTGAIVMILNIDGSISMINEGGCKLLGLSRDELIGKNFIQNFIPEEMQNEIHSVAGSIINGDISHVKEYKIKVIDAQKQEHLVLWTNNYIKDENGNITGIITSGIDITNEEELSKKLFEQEHLYKLTFEEADIGIAHISLDEKWIDTNEYLSNLLGYTKDEFRKMSVADITYEEDRELDAQMIKQLLENKRNSYHIEKRYIHKNGNIIWVNLSVVVLKNETGTPLYFLKIIRDISQLRLLMYQLEVEKSKFQKIIEFTPIPIMLYNEDGEILLVNKIFQDTAGYKLEEIPTIDKFIEKLFVNVDSKIIENIKKYYKDPTKLPKNKQTIQTKFGEERVGILNAVRLDNENILNENMYLIAIVDITDIQKKDELMIAQSRQAAMGDMLAMIAHQWRQPLSVISMVSNNIQAQIQLQEKIDSESLQELIDELNEQTQYLSHTIDDFRNFFKPDKEKELLSLDEIINKLQNIIQKSLQSNDIKFEYIKDINIEVFTYQNQLMQVLINIINNAKDAIKENRTENGLIRMDVTINKKETILKICDNGGGIDLRIKNKLGEPYITTKSENGTGLGIYMSKIIVSKHLGGRLYWESDNEGSCFYISLPNKHKGS
jgi:two-component system CheB/CheR fusion protein